MIALSWVRGLIAHRPTRILATVVGVAVGVALIASIGTFLSAKERAAGRLGRCNIVQQADTSVPPQRPLPNPAVSG